ncbi:hypothetical protein MMPV_006725 [Pyropia vietnamensis]
MDPVTGTNQRGDAFLDGVAERFRDLLPQSIRDYNKRYARSTKAIAKEFKYNVVPHVNQLNASYVAVSHRNLTGAPSDAQLLQAAVAHYNSSDPYEGIRAENADVLKSD